MTTMKIVQFHNCSILRDGVIKREDLWTCGGKIVDPETLILNRNYSDVRRVDCQGLLIAPGFIDVQVNGNQSFSCKTRSIFFFSLFYD